MLLTPACQAQPVRIMMLGDSLTLQGEGRKPLYDRLAAEGYSFEFVGSQSAPPLRHEGHGGYTIGPDDSKPGSLYANVDTWIPAARPDVIFLLVGNNDFNGKPGVDPKGAPDRLVALLEKISKLAPNADIIVSTGLKIAFVDDYAGALNRRIPGIVDDLKKKGLRVHVADLNKEVDLIKGTKPYNGPDSDYSDGTHLNAAGGKKLADVRYTHLVPFLKKPAK
ncbi:MAG: GDSL-type esterase/lipase family protein [Candidatus Methylacidiphilales bacterium]|nr:GDSL-type esterase/lipase family protein [Candidatus Methylacidiphilales bacterium]